MKKENYEIPAIEDLDSSLFVMVQAAEASVPPVNPDGESDI